MESASTPRDSPEPGHGTPGSPPPAEPAQIVARGVRKVFQTEGRALEVLQDVSLRIRAGEFVCLLGPSGCGKSTLLNAVAGFSLPTSGELTVDGRPVTAPGPDRGMVFQEYALFPWMTVHQNVAFGLEIKRLPAAEIARRVEALLRKLHLWDFRARFPKDLSGGMRQRVAIARVLALDPPILLMDEPFGALDALTRRNLQDELLRIWFESKKTVLFVTHSIEESIYLADRIVAMTYRPGRIKREERVALPRPRDPSSPAFNELKRELGFLVMEEQQRHREAELHLSPGSTAD
jgi:NitT/TauT family transport system ATP-binding protein